MGLLDDEYRGAPEWQRQPANDPRFPWVGLLGRTPRPAPPDLPPGGEQYPDAFAYPQPLPRIEGERAYRPTLQYEDSLPGKREAETLRRRRRANYDNEPFQQPKTAEEIGLPPMTQMEKLRLLLNQYLGGNF